MLIFTIAMFNKLVKLFLPSVAYKFVNSSPVSVFSLMKFRFKMFYCDGNFYLIVFSCLCIFNRAVKFTSKLFGRALSRRIKATVLYASETGRSEQYAKQLVELLSHAFNAQVIFFWRSEVN